LTYGYVFGGDLSAQIELVKSASTTPATRAAASAQARDIASFCANCHGDTGISKFPEVPNLAGQNPIYLLTQMDKFQTGARKNEFMQKLIKVLSDKDRANLVVFYANSDVIPSLKNPGPHVTRGEKDFTTLCVRCHGPQARGGEAIPRLAGQQAQYLKLSIDRYRSVSGERIFAPMTEATSQIPANDVGALVDYLSSMN
jgi:cytochrome c553